MSDYDDWTGYGYDPSFDVDHDGKHDFYEYCLRTETLYGDDNDDDDDDDYYFDNHYSSGGSSRGGASSRSSYSSRNASSGVDGLSVGQSLFYGLLAYLAFFVIIDVNPGDYGEYLPVILWGIISLVLYVLTNSKD